MVTIQKNGNAVQFTFDDNSQYLYNGTIDVPVNSLSLVIDDSDLVTFKKAFSNDIFLSVHLDELGMSKQQVVDLYKDIMVGATGGGSGSGMTPEEVQELIDESISGKADTSAITDIIDDIADIDAGKADISAVTAADDALAADIAKCFDGVAYDSSTKRINFKHGETVKGYVDATDFIKDGMVDNVAIENGKLVITFNTDSGKEAIEISLTDIFNPANYYDKAATDALVAAAVSGKTDNSAFTAYQQTVAQALGEKEDVTAHSADMASVNASLSAKADTTAVTAAISSAVASKADSTAVTAVNDALTAHTANTAVHVTTDEKMRWNAVSGKADTTAVTAAISDYTYDKATIDEKVAEGGTFDPTQYYNKTATEEKIQEAVSGKADASAVTQVSDTLTAHTADTTVHVTAAEKSAWNAKADTSDIPSVESYFDGAEYDSNTKRINFKHDGTVKQYIDATAFIKDGMVDNVDLSGTDLVITFNTDAGKENIVIDTTSIFNPSNYYTTAQTDTAIANATSGKADTTAVTAISESLTGKADNSAVTAVNDALTAHTANTEIHVTAADKTNWNGKATAADINAAVSGKADTTAVTTSLSSKQDRLTAGSGISITNNTISVTAETGSANIVSLTQAEYDALVNKDPDTLYVISDADPIDVYSKSETDALLALKANASALSGKADTTAVTAEISAAVSGKQDTLIAGTGIEISGNTISTTGGGGGMSEEVEQLIAASLNELNDKLGHKLGQQYANSVAATYATKTELSGVSSSIDSKIAAYGYDKAYIDSKEHVISSALNDLKKNAGASVTVDDAMSDSSENPVQNKVIKTVLDAYETRIAALETALQGIQTVIDNINGD